MFNVKPPTLLLAKIPGDYMISMNNVLDALKMEYDQECSNPKNHPNNDDRLSMLYDTIGELEKYFADACTQHQMFQMGAAPEKFQYQKTLCNHCKNEIKQEDIIYIKD